jgi:hypothetical protein
VDTWFVSTVNKLPGEPQFSFIWAMQQFESESAARRYAKDALIQGLRVEAGTLSEIQPEVRVRWREAADWVASKSKGTSDANYGESCRRSTAGRARRAQSGPRRPRLRPQENRSSD